MFYHIYNADLCQLLCAGYIFYGILGLFVLLFVALFVLLQFIKPEATAAAFGQAILRPNRVLFGVAVVQSLYGQGNVGIMMLMNAVAAPTAVASYPMAVAMDADGEVAGQMVAFTTLFSRVSIFDWTALLTGLGVL